MTTADPASSIGLPIPDDNLTLGRSLLRSVDRFGPREAMVFEDRRWTYTELGEEVERCARALVAAGVTKGTRVGLLLGARPEFVIANYAIAMVGGVSVLISTFSTDEELEWILRHSDAAILIAHTHAQGRAVLDGITALHDLPHPSLPFLRRIVHVENGVDAPEGSQWSDLLAEADAVDPAIVGARCAEVLPTSEGVQLYTSGSTSTPKGVLHSQRAPVMQSCNMARCMTIGADDRVFTSFPLFWTAGWATGIGSPFSVGATTVLQEFFHPQEAGMLIEREHVTTVRQMIHDEQRLVAADPDRARDWSSIRVGVVTEALRERTSAPAPALEICGWGMTETFTLATMLPFDAPADLRLTTMGRPAPGTEIRIRDRDTGAALGPGELGEITVRGWSLMLGYAKSPDPLPLDDAGFLPTNDAGSFTDDGLLVFAGRLDRLIKTAGVNVSPIEIEELLLTWGRLGTTTVLGIPHPSRGMAIVLCAARVPGDDVSADDVRTELRTHLASYKVPQHVVFLDESEFPLTVSHKVDVPALEPLVVARLLEDEGIDDDWREHLQRRTA